MKSRGPATLPILFGALLLAAACERSPVSSSDATVRDSGGVRIVENPPVADLDVVAVGAPTFRVGWAREEPAFEHIRGGVLLPGGGAVVVDGGGARLYLIDSRGNAEPVGREGEGPGEFRTPRAVERLPDGRLAVWDDGLDRLSTFSPEGRFLESSRVPVPGPVGVTPYGMLGDGRMGWIPSDITLMRGEGETSWIDGPLLVSGSDGSGRDTILEVPYVRLELEDGLPSADPFTRFGSGGVHAGGFVWATNDRSEIHWIDANGVTTQVARWDQEAVEVDDELWRRYEGSALQRRGFDPDEPPSEQMAQTFRNQRAAAPDELPYFRYVEVATSGETWLSEYTFGGAFPRKLLVVSPDGRTEHWLEFENPIRVLDVAEGRVLGIETDALDVQAVVVYSLPR